MTFVGSKRQRLPKVDLDFDYDWDPDLQPNTKKSRQSPPSLPLGQGHFKVEKYLKRPDLNGKYRNWDIARILSSEPVHQISIQELKHNLKLSEWDNIHGKRFSAKQYLKNPQKPEFQEHDQRIKTADLSYPVYVWKDGDTNQFFLIDGLHRYVKLWMNPSPNQKISAKILTDEHLQLLQSPLRYLVFASQENSL